MTYALVDGDVTETQLPDDDVVYTLDADIAAVNRSRAADVLLAGDRQLQSTPVVAVEAATSRQRVRPVADTHVNRIRLTCQSCTKLPPIATNYLLCCLAQRLLSRLLC